jgi:hypothetical protein
MHLALFLAGSLCRCGHDNDACAVSPGSAGY